MLRVAGAEPYQGAVLLGEEEGRSLQFELKERTANVNDASLYPVEASGILYKSSPEMIHLKRVLSVGQERRAAAGLPEWSLCQHASL